MNSQQISVSPKKASYGPLTLSEIPQPLQLSHGREQPQLLEFVHSISTETFNNNRESHNRRESP